jgi:hypothetical protein
MGRSIGTIIVPQNFFDTPASFCFPMMIVVLFLQPRVVMLLLQPRATLLLLQHLVVMMLLQPCSLVVMMFLQPCALDDDVVVLDFMLTDVDVSGSSFLRS